MSRRQPEREKSLSRVMAKIGAQKQMIGGVD